MSDFETPDEYLLSLDKGRTRRRRIAEREVEGVEQRRSRTPSADQGEGTGTTYETRSKNLSKDGWLMRQRDLAKYGPDGAAPDDYYSESFGF